MQTYWTSFSSKLGLIKSALRITFCPQNENKNVNVFLYMNFSFKIKTYWKV